ncbi:MAG: gliding motility protein GldL [Flavobacteriales bacterium]|nr:gliding motility protein GldL [Flavobacteriales bacterium]
MNNSNTSFLGSHSWKKFVNVAYNLGASVVIIGAMFKILHLPYGDLIIGIGLMSEATLFAITAIDPIGWDYKWERVFPSLVSGEGADPNIPKGFGGEEKTEPLSSKMDKMLKDAGIDARLMQSLSDGMNRLSNTTVALSSVGDVGNVSQNYTRVMGSAVQNMETLNRLYGTQIELTGAQIDSTRKVSSALYDAAQSSMRIQGEMQSLSENLSQLNGIYGGVLTAMGGKRNNI